MLLLRISIQSHPPQLCLLRRQSSVFTEDTVFTLPRLHHGGGKRPDLNIANTPFVFTFTSQTPKQDCFRVGTTPLSSLPYINEYPAPTIIIPSCPGAASKAVQLVKITFTHPFFLRRQVLLKSSLHLFKYRCVGRLDMRPNGCEFPSCCDLF
jgi:hypothetical protein